MTTGPVVRDDGSVSRGITLIWTIERVTRLTCPEFRSGPRGLLGADGFHGIEAAGAEGGDVRGRDRDENKE